jgi:hypothetical protein
VHEKEPVVPLQKLPQVDRLNVPGSGEKALAVVFPAPEVIPFVASVNDGCLDLSIVLGT